MKRAHNFRDRVGDRYGHLVVLRLVSYLVDKEKTVWLCRCDCGREIKTYGSNLGRSTRSCGCSKKDGHVHRRTSAADFWNALVRQPTGCWELHKDVTRPGENGYARARFNTRRVLGHRLAWELTNGPIPVGMQVCHRCDNRRCCNPAHLFLGTARDNSLDCLSKERLIRRLYAPQVHCIFLMGRAGIEQHRLARMFRVSRATVSDIYCGRTWARLGLVRTGAVG